MASKQRAKELEGGGGQLSNSQSRSPLPFISRTRWLPGSGHHLPYPSCTNNALVAGPVRVARSAAHRSRSSLKVAPQTIRPISSIFASRVTARLDGRLPSCKLGRGPEKAISKEAGLISMRSQLNSKFYSYSGRHISEPGHRASMSASQSLA